MSTFRWRAIGLAAALAVVALAVLGFAGSSEPTRGDQPSRLTPYEAVVDHGAAVSARPLADRSSADLRQDHAEPSLLAWLGVLLAAAVLARTAARSVELRTLRSGSTVWIPHRFDRGPPTSSFA